MHVMPIFFLVAEAVSSGSWLIVFRVIILKVIILKVFLHRNKFDWAKKLIFSTETRATLSENVPLVDQHEGSVF